MVPTKPWFAFEDAYVTSWVERVAHGKWGPLPTSSHTSDGLPGHQIKEECLRKGQGQWLHHTCLPPAYLLMAGLKAQILHWSLPPQRLCPQLYRPSSTRRMPTGKGGTRLRRTQWDTVSRQHFPEMSVPSFFGFPPPALMVLFQLWLGGSLIVDVILNHGYVKQGKGEKTSHPRGKDGRAKKCGGSRLASNFSVIGWTAME